MSDYVKKRRISTRTATTRLYTDDEREVQRRATNEGKDRSEIIRQAVSNAFRTERLGLAHKDETMQPVIDTYRKFTEESSKAIRWEVQALREDVERLVGQVNVATLAATARQQQANPDLTAITEHLETIACSARYNTEQSIVIRSLMQLYIFDIYHQLEMQCGLDPALTGQAFKERMNEFRHEAGNELARIMEASADYDNQNLAEQLIEKLYRHLAPPLPMETRQPRW
jgi:hypothetical protein